MSARKSNQPHKHTVGRWLRLRSTSVWRRFFGALQIFVRNPLALVGVILVALFGLLTIAYPVLMATVWPKGTYDPKMGYDIEIMHPSPPSFKHLLGTDPMGRDILSMLLAGTAPEFVLGFTAALTAATVGTTIGMLSAYYYRRTADIIFMHLSDAFLLMPAPLVLVIISVRFVQDIGPLEFGLIYGVLAGVSNVTVVMRAHALTVMTKPFIAACRVAGGGARHIILRHLLPHMLPMATLYMMLTVTGAVVADGFVSFFGLARVHLNWGSMMFQSFSSSMALGTGYDWHTLIPPSVALSLFAAAFYLIGRGIHQIIDPRLRKR